MQRFCVSFFNAFVTAALAAVLCALAFRLTNSRPAAFAAALMYGLATFGLAHARTYFSEPLATLCVFSALTLLYLGLRKGSMAQLIAGGALAGFSVLVRVDSVITIPWLLLYLGWALWRPDSAERLTIRRRVILGVSFLIPMGICALILLSLNFYRYGSIFETGYSDQTEGVKFGTPLLVGLQGLLFSVGRGLIYFSPPLILCLWAFPSLWKIERRLTLTIALLVSTVLCFHAKWINWSGAWCWGPRHIYLIHVFLALPIAAWLAEHAQSSARRIAFYVLCIIGFAVQIYGCSQDFIDFYHTMFRTPGQPPSFYALYSDAEEPWHQPYYIVVQRHPDGATEPMSMRWLGAPVNDSLYIPQNSCWAGYALMWQAGHQDFFWLRYLRQLQTQ